MFGNNRCMIVIYNADYYLQVNPAFYYYQNFRFMLDKNCNN